MIVNPRDTLTEVVTQCACGRSPTGRCVGWHDLTEEQFERLISLDNFRRATDDEVQEYLASRED